MPVPKPIVRQPRVTWAVLRLHSRGGSTWMPGFVQLRERVAEPRRGAGSCAGARLPGSAGPESTRQESKPEGQKGSVLASLPVDLVRRHPALG